ESLDEALAYINAGDRPLAMYVFDRQPRRVDAVLDACTVGGVTVNDVVVHLAQHALPFGGVGPSGMGSYHGHQGFLTFS
ncbi:MAG TPA: aldehyde dehydrogenase family protein, partial [Rhodocyclaceae bacterium]|nr:aldehyde dehydrogenase family protein [Rhodocyclaceae bacterium]